MDVTFAWWFQMISICWWVIGAQRSFKLFQSCSITWDGFRGHPNELVVLEICQAIKPYLMLLWLPPSRSHNFRSGLKAMNVKDYGLCPSTNQKIRGVEGVLNISWGLFALQKTWAKLELLLWDTTKKCPCFQQAVVELCWKDSNGELLNRRLDHQLGLEAWE